MSKIKHIISLLFRKIKLIIIKLSNITIAKIFYIKQSHVVQFDLRNDIDKKIIVFAPHIDDEILGMGGILKLYEQLNVFIKLIYVTDGRKSFATNMNEEEMKLARQAEGKCIEKQFNNLDITFLNLESMSYSQKYIDTIISAEIQKIKPDIVYCPYLIDKNIDHIMLCKSILLNCNKTQIRLYSVQTPLPVYKDSYLVDYSNYFLEKQKLLNIFESQKIMRESFESVLFYNRILGKKINCYCAENFIIINEDYSQKLLYVDFNPENVSRITALEPIYKALKNSNRFW